MIENLKNFKDQSNEAINSDPKMNTSSFNLFSGTSDPLPVVTVSLRGGKKHRSTTVSGLTFVWYIGVTNSMIKRQLSKYYERKMSSNKVNFSTAAGMYCTNHDVKAPF